MWRKKYHSNIFCVHLYLRKQSPFFGLKNISLIAILRDCTALKVGVTFAAKSDYCDSIDIAGSTIAILLLLWTAIAILLSETFKLVCRRKLRIQ